MTTAKDLVPLSEGCSRCQLSYARGLRLLLVGAVRGQRIEGKYYIDASDLARWKREQARPEPQPAA